MKREIVHRLGNHTAHRQALTLRPLVQADLRMIFGWRNEERVRSQMLHSEALTWEEHLAWFERYQQRDDGYVWIGQVAGVPVSQVSVYDIAHNEAQFGRLIVASHALGRGYGAVSTLAAIEMAQYLGIRKLWLRVKTSNAAAIRIYKACGFRKLRTPSEPGILHMQRVIEELTL